MSKKRNKFPKQLRDKKRFCTVLFIISDGTDKRIQIKVMLY